ncbi:alpha/beta hydrolase [Frondihabitans cladoniiphilus]|uniref:Alpha/beta fold hydrolase n=1 Tax=Frondihabitans cladoniiphilus TaxID=715785 RepID=A0ABP8W8B7_9MICO
MIRLLAVVTIVLAAVYAALIRTLANAVIYPRRARPTKILGTLEPSEVVLSSTPLTRFKGTIGLLYDDETKLAVMKPGARLHEGGAGVVRTLDTPTVLHGNTLARATGNIFEPTDVTEHPPESVDINTDSAVQPAWLYTGTGDQASTWVIHVHGMLAGRDSALRSAHALRNSGWTSLVISYRGDGEAQGERRQASTLGQAEWQDLDAAVTFARAHGAKTVFLVGWSLGATLALYESEKGANRNFINGLVLVSPVINWARSIRFGMTQNRIPAWLATSTLAALSFTVTSRLLGLKRPLLLPPELPRVSVPTLIIHSNGDRTAPFDVSAAFADSSDLVTLETFPPSPHAMEWNADPDRFATTIYEWLSPLVEGPSAN